MASSPERKIDAKSNLNQIKSQLYESTPSSGDSTPDIIEEQKFENDLDYLLTNKENGNYEESTEFVSTKYDEVVISKSTGTKHKAKPKAQNKKFTVADVTKDMEGLDFSSDEDVANGDDTGKNKDEKPNKLKSQKSRSRLNKRKSKSKLNKTVVNDSSTSNSEGQNDANLQIDTNKEATKTKPKRSPKKKETESMQIEETQVNKTAKKVKSKKSRNNLKNKARPEAKPTDAAKTDEDKNIANGKDMDINNETPGSKSNGTDNSELVDEALNNEVEEEEDEALKRKLKNKKRKERRKKRNQLTKESNTSENEESATPSVPSPAAAPSPSKETTSKPEDNPFVIKLRSVKSTINKKYSENLPEVQPTKTIIGMSHQQILHSDLSDVKIKTLMTSSSVSKYAANAVKFVTTHKDDLFGNFENKKIFLTLCINIALYESLGYKKTTKLYPNVLELFGGYAEINLETTRTKLTPSKKDIHQNDLDYSVLSYFGHILIWAAHQQRQGKVPIFADKFGISLTSKEVRSKIGGYHLWDKLFRELQGMNSKRWKHVIKFRNAFQYEEDQFMIILRFMQIDENIP
ncbi:conserved hypothetical protein [Candida dubliniensis CD36]|uniref:Uncharacterized protein n=1 Tax=Candida dubliniensis (strain CD36 / ATCC MYA-646 / CBS 7987 / NCPF 3949 / NRRL Y-17841) TaxID=573826 RepID=B9W7N6_CANDC|nr:conserved hypothetical protein [Candida dubliniensis CD36]CAX44697.1 conserved hypothetical protein [Candida dubliniensis CD36]